MVGEIKPFVQAGKLESLQILWEDYSENTDFGRPIAWDYVFQKVYLHSCLKKRVKISEFLEKIVYPNMDELYQVALRTVFAYGRSLLNK